MADKRLSAHWRVRFSRYLQLKTNFVKVWGTTFGVGFLVVELWMFGKYGGLGWWLFLGTLAVCAGWAWALFMWHAMQSDMQRLSSSDSTREKGRETSRD